MQEWINQTLESPAFSFAVPSAAFLLGLLSSVASAMCSLPMVGAVVGYSASRRESDRRTSLFSALFFIVGTIAALVFLGGVVSLIGEVAQSALGRYGKLFAGMVAVLLGLASLKLSPFKLPSRKVAAKESEPTGLVSAAMFGLALGGGVSVCSMCCNPGVLLVLGYAVINGYSFVSIMVLTAYAIGFSLPLAAIIFGVSLGKMTVKAKKAESVIRTIAGVLLVGVGFYFLATL